MAVEGGSWVANPRSQRSERRHLQVPEMSVSRQHNRAHVSAGSTHTRDTLQSAHSTGTQYTASGRRQAAGSTRACHADESGQLVVALGDGERGVALDLASPAAIHVPLRRDLCEERSRPGRHRHRYACVWEWAQAAEAACVAEWSGELADGGSTTVQLPKPAETRVLRPSSAPAAAGGWAAPESCAVVLQV